MKRERYFEWMRIWKWFALTVATQELDRLYNLLNILWQEERKDVTPEELSAHWVAWRRLEDTYDFANGPEIKRSSAGA